MPRDKAEVEASLVKKGFKPTHAGSDHNWFVYVDVAGKKAIGARTKTSHGRGFDLDDYLLGRWRAKWVSPRSSFSSWWTARYRVRTTRRC